ncbi:uncharacterized protein C1orf189 homolog [Polypterus senegalus]|uniref:uncharacterized protein C1orf189 homolog n=1 Tax=Polypterus senegalus TaxID=55291 RepID=UPI001965FBFE|nr:uncharacterized protein C1orf189 homolog [Polypterus senegalus]
MFRSDQQRAFRNEQTKSFLNTREGDRHLQAQQSNELNIGRKALVQVRRAALEELLHQEYLQYQKELSLMGKAFYQQRI